MIELLKIYKIRFETNQKQIFNPRQGHKGSLENKIFNQTLFFSSLQSFAFLEEDFLSILEKPS